MKHVTLKSIAVAVLAIVMCGTVQAQRVITNTVNPRDLTVYDGQTIDLSIFRYIYKGWNTICLPISLTEAEVNEIFGDDCRLETLVGVENNGTNTKLNFKDVKPDGLKARTPYILYSNKDNRVCEIRQTEAEVTTGEVRLEFSDNTGTTVVFGGATEPGSAQGIYGILVKDNATAAFVDATNVASGIRASRCFIELNGGETENTLFSNHLDYNMTGVEDITAEIDEDELVDVYNVSGVRIATQLTRSDIDKLGKGVYVIKGQKIWVK